MTARSGLYTPPSGLYLRNRTRSRLRDLTPPGFVRQMSGTMNASGVTLDIAVPGGVAIPAGRLLVLGVCTNAIALPVVTTTDAAGNVWTNDGEITNGAATASTHQFRSALTAPLLPGQLITVHFPGAGAVTRAAAAALEFNNTLAAVDGGAVNNNGGVASAAPTTGNMAIAANNALIVGALGLTSSGRIFTPAAGYTAGVKVVSTSGSGDRALVMEWKTVAAAGAYPANGTLDSGSIYGFVGRGYAL